jgi:hypothetical protein
MSGWVAVGKAISSASLPMRKAIPRFGSSASVPAIEVVAKYNHAEKSAFRCFSESQSSMAVPDIA